jgi:glycerophosphoryl diester phosphodiesterase
MIAPRSFPAIVAHRGFWMQYPENTVPAFIEAMRMGVDMVELDVHETKDGEFIVSHDATHALAPQPWRKLTYAQIRASVGDLIAPRLQECIQAIQALPINFEIKSIKHPSKFLKLLEKTPAASGSFISSFHTIDLKTLHRLHCSLPLYLVTALPPRGFQRLFTQLVFWLRLYRFTPNYLAGVSLQYPLVTRRLIRTMHRRGFNVHSWTVNNPKKMQKFIEYGIDGIITNRPDILMDLKKKLLR